MPAAFPHDDRPTPADLVPFVEARAAVLARMTPLRPREVPLGDALGGVLAEDVTAAEDLPPFANSAMDGFAVLAADLAGAEAGRPVHLTLAGEVFAGSADLPAVRSGTAVRIMTGGPVPPGATAVVPVERTRAAGDGILVETTTPEGACIRRAGEDVTRGTTVLRAGRVVDPAAIGMLASVGRATARIRPRPRVAVVSTGDELVEPGRQLGPGQIRDSNGPMLVAQARAAGAIAFTTARLADDPAALRAGLAGAAAAADLVLTSGGVSVGDRDFTKRVLAELGDVTPWRVAMQPGMPQAFGLVNGTPLYALPGNPVSSFVVFETLVRPALRRLAGWPDDRLDRQRARATLGDDVRSPAGKRSFLRVTLAAEEGTLVARLTGGQGSGVLSSCVAADGLALVGESETELPAGTEVDVVLLRDRSGGWLV